MIHLSEMSIESKPRISVKRFHGLESILFILCFFCSCSDKHEKLGPVVTVEMMPVRWACDCADWIPLEEYGKYQYDADTLAAHCVFIEPHTDMSELPEEWNTTGHVVRFTGRYHLGLGFPEGYESQEDVDEAMVLRYTSFELVK